MRALILGAAGQLGEALRHVAPTHVELTALDRSACDLADPAALPAAFDRCRPDMVFNAAAYTAVDRAELEPDLAFGINARAVERLGELARDCGARLVHMSTDYVFDGGQDRRYVEQDEARPVNLYGASKLAGERALARACPEALIVRTSWVYSASHQNFLRRVVERLARGDSLEVVDDQVGTPTQAAALARALWSLAKTDHSGPVHYAGQGVVSRFGWARAVGEIMAARGLPIGRVIPTATKPAAGVARRPGFSALDSGLADGLIGRSRPDWRQEVEEVVWRLIADRASA